MSRKFTVKKKSLWGTFKNAYLRQRNLKKFWNKLDKKNLSEELTETFNLYLNSPSYNWSSKFWHHVIMLHLELIASGKYKNYEMHLSHYKKNICLCNNITSVDIMQKYTFG